MHPRGSMRLGGRLAAPALAVVPVCALLLLAAPLASAQHLSEARQARIARALALSTVSIETPAGRTSGFVVGSERWIVTNVHVVGPSIDLRQRITIVFGSGTTRAAHVIARDADHDLALLEVDTGLVPAPPLVLGDSDAVLVGHYVLGYGSVVSDGGGFAAGMVTGRPDLDLDTAPQVRALIQTDLPVARGANGSPLADRHGWVVGVSWVGTSETALVSVGIPANYLRDFLVRVRARRAAALARASHPPRAILASGMIVEDCAPDELLGVRVLHVAPGSAADQAGLGGAQDPRTTFLDSSAPWTGHVITAADLHAIGNVAELEDYLATRAPGQAVQLSVRWSLDPSARTGETSMIVRAP